MGKKTIRELTINVNSRGAKGVEEELRGINKEAVRSAQILKTFEKHLFSATHAAQGLNNPLSLVSDNAINAAKGMKALNTALNMKTTAAKNRIEDFVTTTEILTLYIKDLGDAAETTNKHLAEMKPPTQSMDKFDDVLYEMLSNLQDMAMSLEHVSNEMTVLNLATRESIETLDRLGDRITDVERQTKKQRIQTEKTTEAIKEGAAATTKATHTQERFSDSAKKSTNDLRRLSGAGSSSARAFSDLAFKMNPMVSLYASIAVNVYALSEAFRVLNESANLGRLINQTAKFSASISGMDIKGLASDMQELSGGALDMGESIRQAVRGISYGFLIEDMEALTVGARKASVALGVTFTDALDRAFRGISKGEVEVLDEIGVVTRLDTAYKNYAVTLNKNADALTEVERRLALTQEVITQLESKFSGFEVAATGVERLGVAIRNLIDNSMIRLSETLDGPIGQLADLIKGFSGVESEVTKLNNAAQVFEESMKARNISQAAVALGQMEKAHSKVRLESEKGTKENIKYLESLEAATKAQELLNRALSVGLVMLTAYAAVLTYKFIVAVGSAAVSLGVLAVRAANSAPAIFGLMRSVGVLDEGLVNSAKGMKGYTAALGGVTKALAAVSKAALKLTIIATVIAGVGYLLYTLADYVSGGRLGEALGRVFDSAKDKAVGLAASIGEGLAGALDAIAKHSGIDDLTKGLTAASNASKYANMSLEEYLGTMGESAKRATSNLKAVEAQISRLENSRRLGQSVRGEFGVLSPEELQKKIDDLKAKADMFREEAGRYSSALQISPEEGQKNLMYLQGLEGAYKDVAESVAALSYQDTALDTLARSVRSIAEVPMSLEVDENAMKEAMDRLENAKVSEEIPANITIENIDQFSRDLDSLAALVKDFTLNAANDLSEFSLGLNIGDPTADIKLMKKELEQITGVLDANAKVGDKINSTQRKELEDRSKLLAMEIEREERAYNYSVAQNALLLAQETDASLLSLKTTYESELLELKVRQLRAQIALAEESGVDTQNLWDQLAAVEARRTVVGQIEATQAASLERTKKLMDLQVKLDSAGTASARLELRKQMLDIEEAEALAMADGLAKQEAIYQVELKRKQLARESATNTPVAQAAGGMNAADFKDMSEVMNSVASIEGLTELQSTFASTMGSMSSVYSDFLAQMETGSGSFMEFLSGNTQAMATMIQGSVAMAQQAFATMSQAKIDGINREIEAEKRRDGKSAESQKKIKQLQAKQIKEEAKAKKASIVMSTAAGIMNIWAGPMGAFPPAAIAMSAMLGVMGMMQLSQVDKAASGQLAGLNDGPKSMSLSGGERSKDIDVRQRANAGELAYLRGEQGVGSAQNFIPGRAGGGFAAAGTRITLGESGPEEITPAIPVKVTSAGASGKAESIVFSPQYNLQAIDAMGMEELMQRHSRSLYEGLEQELNARNKSLNNL